MSNFNNISELTWADLNGLYQLMRDASDLSAQQWKQAVGDEMFRRMSVPPIVTKN